MTKKNSEKSGVDLFEIAKNKEAELIKRAKFKRELIVEIYAEVLSVKSHSRNMRHVPDSEIRLGGESRSYETGYQNKLEIAIAPFNPLQDVVRELSFYGFSPLVSGNLVRAGVFIGLKQDILFTEKDEKIFTDGDYETGSSYGRYVLVPRELQKKEQALYLKVLERLSKSELRTDFSVAYSPEEFS